jgi:hypothetical protein
MNTALLKKHIQKYVKALAANPAETAKDTQERRERMAYYQGWTAERIRGMTPEDVADFISRLWAMLIWGNKQYVVNKIIDGNGLETFREELAALI